MQLDLKSKNYILSLTMMGTVLLLFLSFNTAYASETPTIYVNSHGNDSWNGLSSVYNSTNHDGPKATIKNATATVPDKGTVEVASGTYKENGIVINKEIIIHGQPNTMVDGTKSDRIFTINKGACLNLFNINMLNGQSINGGAIYNDGRLNMVNCSISNCKAVNGDGGAIYNLGYLNVSMSKLNNNNAANGGAIYCYYGYNSFVNFNQITDDTPLTGEIYCPFGIVDANLNWWGSNLDPSNFVNYGVNVTSWIVTGLKTDHNILGDGSSCKVTMDLLHDNFNNYHDPSIVHLPDGMQVIFNTTLGTIHSPYYTKNGTCTTTLKAGAISGTALISAFIDSQELNTTIKINSKPRVVSQTPSNNSINRGNIKTISIVLSEAVQAGTGYNMISLQGPNGNIPVTTSILNNIITIIGTSYFTNGKYNLYLPFNSLKDVSNNYMNQSFYSNFTMDKKAPTITVTPRPGCYNSTKIIHLKLNEAGTVYYTLNNSTPTKLSRKYTGPIKISKTTLLRYLGVDIAGNISTGKITYTIDRTPPIIMSTSPNMLKRNVSTGKSVKIYFNEVIFKGINFNRIHVTNMKTGKSVTPYKNINGNVLILKNLKTRHTWYYISLPYGSVKDRAGNQFKSDYVLKFKTA
jgi:hypothetical protein